MIMMAGPLAYAGDKKDKGASANDSQPATQNNAQTESYGQSPCSAQDPKQNKQKNAVPSDQEREFERVLMGIYG
jgi:hypothetical protein